MPDDNPREPVPPLNRRDYLRHFRDARQPKPLPPPPRPWLPGGLTLMCASLVLLGSFGPWMRMERITTTGPERWMLYGARTDGIFSILFAVIAIVAMVVVLARPGASIAAWIAFGALGMCTVVGFSDWLLFAPSDTNLAASGQTRIVDIEWGVKAVFLAGGAGAISAFIAAQDLAEG